MRNAMASASRKARKHFLLDATKIKRAQRALGAKSETETIELALDLVISEHRKNRLVRKATERFLRSGLVIKDVYGKL